MDALELSDPTLNVPVQNAKPKAKPTKEVDVKPLAAYKPGLSWDGEEMEITTDLYSEPIKDWNELLEELGYDPALYEVIEPVKISSWDAPVGDDVRRLWSYKVNIRVKRDVAYKDEDYKELVSLIKRHKKTPITPSEDGVFFINCADWQMGKADGYGTKGTVEAILEAIENIESRIRDLRKLGREINHIVIAGIGDMVENCDGHYASQTFTVELNRRQQNRLVRRLLIKLVIMASKLAEKVSVYAVPGNHGENRKDGKSYTTVGDNDDVAVFEQVADALAQNPEVYGHVNFYLPEDDIYMMCPIFEDENEYVCFFHGHMTNGGADPRKKIHDWWEDQTFTGKDPGKARLLITGHYHHLSITEYDNNKIHIQCPTIDGGSDWFLNLTGKHSRPGTLTFLIDKSGMPFRDLEVI